MKLHIAPPSTLRLLIFQKFSKNISSHAENLAVRGISSAVGLTLCIVMLWIACSGGSEKIPQPTSQSRDTLSNQTPAPIEMPVYHFDAPGVCGQYVSEYIEELKTKGYIAEYQLKHKEEGDCKYQFTLPVGDIREGFAWMKKIYNLPEGCPFPEKKQTVFADPEHPHPDNKHREAGYITQILEADMDSSGQVIKIRWSDDDEIGFVEIALSIKNNMSVFAVETGSH